MEPILSIIILVYNVERYLPMCLESVASQSFRNFEAIVVDDGSTDCSGTIADEYAQKDNRFRVIHKENGGISSARNAGLDSARGQYLTFADGDDWVHPQMFECLLSTLVKTGAAIAISDLIKTDDSSYSLPEYEDLPNPQVFDGHVAVKTIIENNNTVYTVVWNKLYDRKLIGDTRFLDIVSEDLLFNMILFKESKTVSYLPIPLVYYRQRNDSITHMADIAYYIDKVASAFHSYDKTLRNKYPTLEKLFLWRWLKYALNRLNMANGTEHEQYARQTIGSIMTEYWPDAKRLLPWHKRFLLKSMFENKNFNSFVLTIHKWAKLIKRNP